MTIVVIPFLLLLLLAVGFLSTSLSSARDTTELRGSTRGHLWLIIAALSCVPAGPALPLLLGMQGLEAWLPAIGVWLAGAIISAVRLPQHGPARRWLLFACCANLVLVGLFGPLFFLAAMVSR